MILSLEQWKDYLMPQSKADKIAAARAAEEKARAELLAAEAEEQQAEAMPEPAPVQQPAPVAVAPRTYGEAAILAEQKFQQAIGEAAAVYQGKAENFADYNASYKLAETARRLALAEALKLPGVPAARPPY